MNQLTITQDKKNTVLINFRKLLLISAFLLSLCYFFFATQPWFKNNFSITTINITSNIPPSNLGVSPGMILEDSLTGNKNNVTKGNLNPAKKAITSNLLQTKSFPQVKLTKQESVNSNSSKIIQYSGMSIKNLASRDFNTDTSNIIVAIENNELPALTTGMVNVTLGEAGYKTKFTNTTPVVTVIHFDPKKIPAGYTINDIHTYRYEKIASQWLSLKRDSLDISNHIVYSTTTKDGDYINAIIKAPDAPETQGYAPTTMNDIKVGDPSSMLQIIEPPTANNQGTATLNYYIETPLGRQDMQPDLKIVYSSDGGNGWLGEGWSLNGISSITVDTRWGVPRYSEATETETYLLDGQMLAYNKKEMGKTPNRYTNIKRADVTENNTTSFAARKQLKFEKIERIGSKPENYYWIITDTKGTKYYYGRENGVEGFHNGAVLKKTGTINATPANGIAEWKLVRVEDVFKNFIQYVYQPIDENGYLFNYPAAINYTRNAGNPNLSYYRVVFTYDNTRKDNLILNARYGVVINANARRLKEIKILKIPDDNGSVPQPVRRYTFDYSVGAFGKSVLHKLTQFGDDETEFNNHVFKYYNEDGAMSAYITVPEVAIADKSITGNVPNILGILNNNTTAIGGSKSSSNSISIYAGVGAGNPASVDISGGISYNNTSSSAEGLNTLVDIDGDGLPDKVYVRDGVLQYQKNKSVGNKIEFASNSITIVGIDQFIINQFMEEKSRTTGWGARANFVVTAGYDQSSTETVVSKYFADANGDGLMDIVNGGNVYFNTGNVVEDKALQFSLYSSNTPSLVYGTGAISATLTYNDVTSKDLIANSPLQEVVRTWEAPFKGEVTIDAPVQLLPVKKGEDADGVWVSIEYRSQTAKHELELKETDIAVHPWQLNNITVEKGDKIFFRIQPGRKDDANGANDKVQWDPKINYTKSDDMGMDTLDKKPAVQRYAFQASENFLLSNSLPVTIPDGVTKLAFSGKFKKDVTMDTVTVQVIQLIKDVNKPLKDANGNIIKDNLGKTVYDFSYDNKPLFEEAFKPEATALALNIPVPLTIKNADRKIQCIVKSTVNIDLDKIVWEPTITYDEPFKKTKFDANNNPVPDKDTSITRQQFLIPYYIFNDTLRYVGRYDSSAADATYDFYPSLTLQDAAVDSSFWFCVKTTQQVLDKKLITYKNGRLTDNTPLSVKIEKGTPFIVSVEAQIAVLGKLKDDAYNKICNKILRTEYMLPGTKADAYFLKAPITAPANFITIPKDGYYNIVPELSVQNNITAGKIVMQVWVNNVQVNFSPLDSIVNFVKNDFVFPINNLRLPLNANDKVVLQFISSDDDLIKNPALVKKFSINQTFPADFWINRQNETFGPMYANWGQFVYNGMGRYNDLIKVSDLKIDGTTANGLDVSGFNNNVNNAVNTKAPIPKDANFDKLSAVNAVFSPMLPFADNSIRCWLGAKASIYLQPAITSTARLGLDNVEAISPFTTTTTASANSTFARGIPKVSTSSGETYSGGILSVTGNHTDGKSEQVSDYMDMNGDRYPDIVSAANVQITDATGSLSETVGNAQATHKGTNNSNGLSVSGTSGASKSVTTLFTGKTKPATAPIINAESSTAVSQASGASIGGSGAYNNGDDKVTTTWMDVNADGLPDKVSPGGYELNLGYNNFQPHAFNFEAINKANNISLSPGITAGFTSDKNSFSGGAGLSFSNSKSNQSIQDMNGDGLPDKITIGDDGNVVVQINTGNNFINYPWGAIAKGGNGFNTLADAASFPLGFLPQNPITNPWFNLEKTKFNASNSVSLGGSATFGFSILLVKVVINPAFNHSEGIGRTVRQFIDINGDGYPDYVYSTQEGKMEVMLSNLGKSNKLQGAENSLGGSFSMNYEHTDATTEHPGGKWVMNNLEINDGIKEDREDADGTYDSKKTFTYTKGKFDRYEREFLGFGTVTTTDMDFKGKPYRNLISKYDTKDYYNAGHLLEELLQDAQNSNKKYTITRNEYYPLASNNTITIDSFKCDVGIAFTPLKYTINGTFEGAGDEKDIIWLNKSNYTYNTQYGYVTQFTYKESPANTGDNSISYQTKISYDDDVANYIIGLPIDVITTSPDSKVTYKHTAASYYKKVELENGLTVGDKLKMKTSSVYLEDGKKSTTIYQYDVKYGILSSKQLPNGIKYNYSYDAGQSSAGELPTAISNTFSYITKVENETYDNFSSEIKYDFRYGIPVQTKDINDNYINTRLDHFGRIIQATGPVECNNAKPASCGKAYTIKIDYSFKGAIANPFPSIAQVTHYDEGNSGIQTINFIDGFKRTAQIKKTAAITNAGGSLNKQANWTVSGRVMYDAFGRAAINYYPDLDSANGYKFFTRIKNKKNATTFGYDVQDRGKTKMLPDGNTEFSTDYSRDGDLLMATSTYFNKDINGVNNQTRKTYTNGSGLKAKETVIEKNGNEISTQFKYDPIHQLIQTKDNQNNTTYYAYDYAGNQTGINHPDAGTTAFKYDDAGRLTDKITANGDGIKYGYDYDRLATITYPRHPENNVLYIYSNSKVGDNNSRNNLVYQEDASGAQVFEYDRLGNISKTTRTIIAPFSSKLYTFITMFKYDTWNRVKSITYPDGDTIKYAYNEAGLLKSVVGQRAKNSSLAQKQSVYVSNIGYDEFEQRISLTYGNKTQTSYTYQEDRRRLAAMNVTGINNASAFFTAFNSAYTYDNQNNITIDLISKTKLGSSPSSMNHRYFYDNLNRIDSSAGDWVNNGEVAAYRLGMGYDDLYNIENKNLVLTANKLGAAATTVDYTNKYDYTNGKPHQLSNFSQVSHRNGDADYTENNAEKYYYDSNGNDTLKTTADKSGHDKINERKINWDEENRINAISINGFVSHYIYDASGERTIKLSVENEGVYVNGKYAGDTLAPATFSLYASPYYSMRNGNGIYSKHIYIGTQLIITQVENDNCFDTKIPPASMGESQCPLGSPLCDGIRNYGNRRDSLNKRINNNFGVFNLPYQSIKENAFDTPPVDGYDKNVNPFTSDVTGKEAMPTMGKPELLSYYYHSNQIGSTSFVTDKDAKVVQYVEYLPFGETFMELRQNYSSQFLFNAKEQDQETGLYYYGARYYDPHTYQWLGVDPMAEKYPGLSPYNFNLGNPVKMVDVNGKESDENACNDVSGESQIKLELSKEKVEMQRQWMERIEANDRGLEHPLIDPIDIVTLGAGAMVRGAANILEKKIAAELAENVAAKAGGKELFNFGSTVAKHMAEPSRAVPVQILEQTIKGSKGVVDPQGSRALMHSIEMFRNGKAYKLDVLYDKATNSIWHFQYSPIKP